MTKRDDFENRLGQGLKRWAQAGEPTMDLEALVRQRVEAGPVTALPATRRRLPRWLGLTAAAAALVLSVGLSFPKWAGAAAEWPLVGPVVTEIIMKDAGLKWAYDTGLIQGNLAEVRQGGVTVRILGVMADSRRTTVIYQVKGAPARPKTGGKPMEARGLARPVPYSPTVDASISKVDGKGGFSSFSPPTETPVGWVGTVSTLPLEGESAELELTFRVGDERLSVTVPASRAETDKYSREVVLNETREIDGIAFTVETVTFTPAETIIRYREEKEPFFGSVQWDPETEGHYLEVDGTRYAVTGGGSGVNHVFHEAYPAVTGKSVKLVFPAAVKGVPVEATWPLTEGAVAEVLGVPVTLASYQREGDVVSFEWESPDRAPFVGVSTFEVIDQNGEVYDLSTQSTGWSSESNYVDDAGIRHRRFSMELLPGVEPVAIRARSAGVKVTGPWIFELPR